MAVMTAAMVRDIYAANAKPGAVLATISAEGVDEPIRVTDWPGGLDTAEGFYSFAPFNVVWIGAGDGEASRAPKLEIGASGELVELIRLAPNKVDVEINHVRVVAPNYAERALKGLQFKSCEVADGVVQIALKGRDLSSEYAVSARYTLSRTPGLF